MSIKLRDTIEDSPSISTDQVDPHNNTIRQVVDGAGISPENTDYFTSETIIKIKGAIQEQRISMEENLMIAINLLSDEGQKSNILADAKENSLGSKLTRRKAIRLSKAITAINAVPEDMSSQILAEVKGVQTALSSLSTTEFSKKIGLAGMLWAINFGVSNIAELSTIAGLTILLSKDIPIEAKAIISGIITYSAMTAISVGPPSIAGVVRYLWFKLPEEVILKTINLTQEPSTVIKTKQQTKGLFKPQELLMILEGATPLVFLLETARLLNLDISVQTLKYIRDVITIKKIL